ncbi:FadR/GntR family transcriptional regulator [Sphingomonas sp. ERG5]|uniref:FadR/GntR family transcriptional regulator n=1 Tax=Sphingomonas sp. ERG5 TaxID=1381597 RepID=UPI00054C289E|nr:FadR/GntR family transcriptional regulator [Sphingomonas sp. ERG5]
METGKKRLYQGVAQAIVDGIKSGEFPPGTRLPGERELAERFDVSRVTIREAEIALEAQGYITIKTGSGVYVRKDNASTDRALPDVSAFELTTARSVIEAEGAALAAGNISDAELGELQRLIDGMAASDRDGLTGAEDLDERFHLVIAKATGNLAIEHLIGQLWRMRSELPRVREVYAGVCAANAQRRAHEHQAIFEALQRRDSAGARVAMREHFHRLFETMLAAREDAALAELKRSMGEDRQRFLQATLL